MTDARRRAKRIINVLLPIAILGDMAYYQFCLSSCAYMKGDLFGIDMKLVGLVIPLPLIAVALLKWDLLYLLGLAFGIGGEIKLISYQIGNGVYCPYCLFAAAVMLFLLIFNFDRRRPGLIALFVIIGFLVFQFFFHASATPSFGYLPFILHG